MRDIEFRGVSMLDLKWVYGALVRTDCYKPNWEDLENPIIVNNYRIYCRADDWSNIYHNIPVIGETVGQYTGLFDKNGQKIYEGDIIKARHNEDYYTVSWKDNGFHIEDKWGNSLSPKQTAISRFACEVVGNIYYNSKLLKREEDEES